MNKKTVIQTLEKIATYLEIKGENPFKISAYRKAAAALETDERTLDEIDETTKIKGIGKGTTEVILELKNEGRSSLLQQLQEELPEGLLLLLKLPGLGGKRIGALYRELHITNIETLKEACLNNQIQTLAGFGKKTEENLLKAVEEMSKKPDRFALPEVLPVVQMIEEKLSQMEAVIQYSRAGSLRRLKESVKDLDFIIATTERERVQEQLLSIDKIARIIANGPTKVSIELVKPLPISVDFRLVLPEQFATTLHHFTGSKEHNVKLRQLAKERQEKISEYGVESLQTGEVKTFQSERDFFAHFQLTYIPPESREDRGEIEYAAKKDPYYIKDEQIKGDLHMHTTWSDGAHSIEDMAEAARIRGYEYIAITDHSRFLKVANGLSVERLRKQHEHISALNEQYDDFKILTGIEMDILPDGSLDYDDELLAEMDFVIAAIHSSFQQDEQTIMKRLQAALENKHVDLIAHPTGRLLGRRDGYNVNVEKLIELASETGTALELNAQPLRLDLSAEWLMRAREANVPIAINTDAHRTEDLSLMTYGTGTARRAMLNQQLIMNTWPLEKLLGFLQKNK